MAHFRHYAFLAFFYLAMIIIFANLPARAQNNDTLMAGDTLNVTIQGEPDLSGEYSVSTDGNITMPLIGEVTVKNLSQETARTAITARLADGYLIKPIVSTKIMRHGTIYILGEVRSPGQYTFNNNLNTLKAVALAGGFTYRANTDAFDLLRGETGKSGEKVKISAYETLHDGDVIIVKERLF